MSWGDLLAILQGAVVTVTLSFAGILIGSPIGLALAALRWADVPVAAAGPRHLHQAALVVSDNPDPRTRPAVADQVFSRLAAICRCRYGELIWPLREKTSLCS